MLAGELPKREDLAKLALDRGQISQETYNRMVPPVDPSVPNVELTNVLPDSIPQVLDRVAPGTGTLLTNIGEGVKSMLPQGGENMAGMNQALAEVPLRNPALDEPMQAEIPAGALSTDKLPQSGQASQIAAPNPLAGLGGTFEKQKQSIMKAAEIGAAQAASEAAFQQKMFDESEKMRQDQAVIDQNRQAKLMEYETKLNQKMDEYAKRPANIGQVFSNAGTGQKILMGLALFLGAAPNSTWQNKAVTAMQNAIDSDLAKAKAEVGDRKNAYQELKETFKDERQADAAARLAYLNNAQVKLNQIAAQYKGPQILENAKLLNAKIDEEKEKMKMQFMAAAQTSPAFQQADNITQQIMKFPKEQQKELLEAREVFDATKAAENEIDNIYGGFDVGVSGYIPFTDAKAKLETTHAQIESAIRATMRGQGTIQESEIVRLVNPFLPLITDSKDRLRIKAEQLKTLLKTKNAGQINRLKNAGLLPQERKFSEGAPISTKGK